MSNIDRLYREAVRHRRTAGGQWLPSQGIINLPGVVPEDAVYWDPGDEDYNSWDDERFVWAGSVPNVDGVYPYGAVLSGRSPEDAQVEDSGFGVSLEEAQEMSRAYRDSFMYDDDDDDDDFR